MAAPLVRDFMTTAVTTLPQTAKLLDAAMLLHRTGRRHVPIVDEEGRAVGILSDRDLGRLTPSVLSPVSLEDQNLIFSETPITLAMTKDLVTVLPDSSIGQAVECMTSRKISCVLVEDKGKLCGILTISDVLGLLQELLKQQEGAMAKSFSPPIGT